MTIAMHALSSVFFLSTLDAAQPVPPVEQGGWLVPAEGDNSMPYWGHKNGIGVMAPAYHCPRGLIGIYTPYLGLPEFQPLNFVAIEPVVRGCRGYSEMERSTLDGVQGLRLWTSDAIARKSDPAGVTRPASGMLKTLDGVETLVVYIHIERMGHGAQPIIKAMFRADSPHEVSFRIYGAEGSAKMDSCILTATMGNYARLRLLRLKSQPADATKLWVGERTPEHGFLSHREWLLGELFLEGNAAVVYAEPNETDPVSAEYARKTKEFWKYKGKVATQYWRSPNPNPELVCRVNARETYYGENGRIPGGLAFENFELEAPFAEGQEFCFGATPIRGTQKP